MSSAGHYIPVPEPASFSRLEETFEKEKVKAELEEKLKVAFEQAKIKESRPKMIDTEEQQTSPNSKEDISKQSSGAIGLLTIIDKCSLTGQEIHDKFIEQYPEWNHLSSYQTIGVTVEEKKWASSSYINGQIELTEEGQSQLKELLLKRAEGSICNFEDDDLEEVIDRCANLMQVAGDGIALIPFLSNEEIDRKRQYYILLAPLMNIQLNSVFSIKLNRKLKTDFLELACPTEGYELFNLLCFLLTMTGADVYTPTVVGSNNLEKIQEDEASPIQMYEGTRLILYDPKHKPVLVHVFSFEETMKEIGLKL